MVVGYLARANPQVAALAAGAPSVAVFSGQQAYLSSSWYAVRDMAPTWCYLAVHLHGTPTLSPDDAHTLRCVQALVEHAERGRPGRWPPGARRRRHPAARGTDRRVRDAGGHRRDAGDAGRGGALDGPHRGDGAAARRPSRARGGDRGGERPAAPCPTTPRGSAGPIARPRRGRRAGSPRWGPRTAAVTARRPTRPRVWSTAGAARGTPAWPR
ncbi:FMN-binding negative transcriptional regulator [Pseudonocardia sp. S2-4]|uniref:FMN-binding negative transcriptional regulator n=1 Tax=Pseudonocardia humida TaxID=2800819 RepID=A0ABT0ZXZ2_9PSEU|nr:FMN-binding negative transcriptional regulator [Pseudonocardia humida]